MFLIIEAFRNLIGHTKCHGIILIINDYKTKVSELALGFYLSLTYFCWHSQSDPNSAVDQFLPTILDK